MGVVTVVVGLIACAVAGVLLVTGILLFKEKFYKDAPYDKN